MPLRRVVEYPNPILRETSKKVETIDQIARQLIQDLVDTLHAFPGCIGLAAPQIGEPVQIAVVDVSSKESGKEMLILINPLIVERIGEKVLREGCLSIPNLTANVKRSEEVVVQWMGLNGEIKMHHARGLEAICIQHETDHLNGLFFIDRVLCAKTDIYRRKKYLH